MVDDVFIRALIGGIAVAAVAGPLGCFVVWRRMAYFGETLAHSALLGVGLGLLLHVHIIAGVVVVCVVVALVLVPASSQRLLPIDSFLGILAHTTLALGLILAGLAESASFDLHSYLFGNILAVGRGDLYWIVGGGAVALGLLVLIWRPLLFMTVHEDLARVEGVPVTPTRIVFMLLIALIVALALKIVGVLLITSLLIIPAAAARRFARGPEQMAMIASVIGMAAVAGGLSAARAWDTPAGPSVVVAAAALFALGLLHRRTFKLRG